MIEIKIFKKDISKKESIFNKIIVRGHSGFSKKGYDIVCSAISFIIQSYSYFIYKYYGINIENRKNDNVEIELDLGLINEKLNDVDKEKISLLNKFLEESLFLIYNNYKDNIKIEIIKIK